MLKSEEYEAKNVESLRLGRDADKLAVIEDPAGYAWEVLERHERGVAEPLCKVSCSSRHIMYSFGDILLLVRCLTPCISCLPSSISK